MRIDWTPQLGDVIQRTVQRGDHTRDLSYTLERSNYQLIRLGVNLIPALLAFLSGLWLLRRWGAEPGVQIFFMLMMSVSFVLVATIVSPLIPFFDTVALHIVLPLLLHFVLIFPEPIRYFERHPRRVCWLYLPFFVALAEF